MKPKLVFLTGAGVSAESGIKTFRDHDGLWENYPIEDVASIDGWKRNPTLVQEFYNARRAQAATVLPNAAHMAIVDLERFFDVAVITQNVDNLHEKAGSKNVLHVHGSLFESKSEKSDFPIFNIETDIKMGDLAPDGGQLRPNIVWFGEAVPMIDKAAGIIERADIVVVVGTSMQVYPAAGLVDYAQPKAKIYCIDPKPPIGHAKFMYITETATTGMKRLFDILVSDLT